jgi:hypothetical protein
MVVNLQAVMVEVEMAVQITTLALLVLLTQVVEQEEAVVMAQLEQMEVLV